MNNLSNASFLCYNRLAVHFGSYHIAPVFKEPLPIQIAKKDKGKGKAKQISTEEREEQFVEPAGHHNCLRMFSHNDIDFNEHSIELEEANTLEAL
jgi:hypothetical protein